MIINIFLTAGLCLTAILGDFLVQKFEHSHILKAVIDNGTHAAIGGLTWSVVCFQRKIFPSSSEIIWQVLLCTVVASMTDVDHFIEAKSLKLQVNTLHLLNYLCHFFKEYFCYKISLHIFSPFFSTHFVISFVEMKVKFRDDWARLIQFFLEKTFQFILNNL